MLVDIIRSQRVNKSTWSQRCSLMCKCARDSRKNRFTWTERAVTQVYSRISKHDPMIRKTRRPRIASRKEWRGSSTCSRIDTIVVGITCPRLAYQVGSTVRALSVVAVTGKMHLGSISEPSGPFYCQFDERCFTPCFSDLPPMFRIVHATIAVYLREVPFSLRLYAIVRRPPAFTTGSRRKPVEM